MIGSSALLIVCCSCLLISISWGRDMGVIGKTYQIVEEDMIEFMQKRIMEKQKNGELKQELNRFKQRSEEITRRPPGLNLPAAKFYRINRVDPSYELTENIIDGDGKILYKTGMKINPLKVKALSKRLCFFDGDNPKQVAWIVKICGSSASAMMSILSENKLILVKGDFEKINKDYNYQRRFYFDQYGYLVKRLGVQSLPAIVTQKGDFLYVEEFPVN